MGQSARMRLGVTIMDKLITLDPEDANSTDFKTEVSAYIAEVDRVRERMETAQDEIDRLKAETREILARLKAA